MVDFKNSEGLTEKEFHEKLNKELRKAVTSKDMEKIMKEVEEETVHPVYLIMKRSGKTIEEIELKGDRVNYILNDGHSNRSSKVRNLYRNIYIGV